VTTEAERAAKKFAGLHPWLYLVGLLVGTPSTVGVYHAIFVAPEQSREETTVKNQADHDARIGTVEKRQELNTAKIEVLAADIAYLKASADFQREALQKIEAQHEAMMKMMVEIRADGEGKR
jgi:uncharacterized membrane protein